MASAQSPPALTPSPKLIVADAGPLIALAVGGVLPQCLEMLGGLYVPEAVLQECVADVSAPGTLIVQDLHRREQFHTVSTATLVPLDAAFAAGLGDCDFAVLAQLKRQGPIDSVQPVLVAWAQHRYFISEQLQRDIQHLAGEG